MKKNGIESKERQIKSSQNWTSRTIEQALLERSSQAALAFGVELLEQEVSELCGAPFFRKGDSLFHRGGSEKSSFGGKKNSATGTQELATLHSGSHHVKALLPAGAEAASILLCGKRGIAWPARPTLPVAFNAVGSVIRQMVG